VPGGGPRLQQGACSEVVGEESCVKSKRDIFGENHNFVFTNSDKASTVRVSGDSDIIIAKDFVRPLSVHQMYGATVSPIGQKGPQRREEKIKKAKSRTALFQ
jgi:hypothetical protein